MRHPCCRLLREMEPGKRAPANQGQHPAGVWDDGVQEHRPKSAGRCVCTGQCLGWSVRAQVYAIIPPFLLCAYAAVGGPGVVMHALCFLAALASTSTGLAAVGVLWAIPKYNSAGKKLRIMLMLPGMYGTWSLLAGHPW